MTLSNTSILDLNYYSSGFPIKIWGELIERDNFISELNSTFRDNTNLIFLSGPDDIGKSTLCAEFCKKNLNNSISVFFNEYNTLDLTVDFLRMNIYYQIQYFLGNDIDDDDEFVTSEMYRLALLNLRKKFRKGNTYIHLVIDGLSNRTSSKDIVKKIIEEIPFGERHIKVIVSGSSSEFLNSSDSLKKVESKDISLVGFTQHQIQQFLGNKYFKYTKDEDILNITRNYPGRLEVLKRLLDDNTDIKKIINSKNYQSWIDLDTSNINIEDPVISLILSLLSLTDKNFVIEDLINILSSSYKCNTNI